MREARLAALEEGDAGSCLGDPLPTHGHAQPGKAIFSFTFSWLFCRPRGRLLAGVLTLRSRGAHNTPNNRE